jgi:asparagine synthase (glutamine-hydrolysing)
VKIEECMDSIRSLTRQSVHSQLISDVPVGAFLSGGVDSSAVVAFARERSPGIRCFTIDSGGAVESGQRDDLPFARGVARSLGVALDEVPVRESEFIESLWSMPEMFDEPIADPAALNTWFISRAARAAGVKVLLSGTGADDLFSGYRRHSILRLEALRRILPPSVRSGFGRMIAAIGSGASVPRRIGKYLNCEESGDFALIAQLMEWTPSRAVAGILSDDGTGSIAGQIAAPLIEHLATTDSNDDLRLALSLDQRFFLGDHNLLYADRLSMAEGVEIRVPLLSDRLVHVSWRVPSKWMVRGREAKWAFRKALRGHVPDLALDRRKSGFGLPLRRWTRSMLRGPLADVLFCTSAKQRGLLRADRVQDVWQSTMEGRLDGAYLLLSMALFELWCVRFIDVGGQESSDASATKLGFSVSGWPARTQS